MLPVIATSLTALSPVMTGELAATIMTLAVSGFAIVGAIALVGIGVGFLIRPLINKGIHGRKGSPFAPIRT